MTVPTQEIRVSLNIPNMLTGLRVVLAAVVAWLLLLGTEASILAAGIVLVCAALTDWADGYLARRMGHASLFGSLFDVCADQFLFMPALILSVHAGLFDRAAGFMFWNPYPYAALTLAGGVTVLAGVIVFLIKRQKQDIEFPTPPMLVKVNYWFWIAPLILAVFKLGPDLLLAILMYAAIVTTLMSFYTYLKKGSYVFTD